MNLRPPGYEPDELPDCSIPRCGIARRRSTFTGGEPPAIINAEELNFRVRHGNGWDLFAVVTALCILSLNKTIIILPCGLYERKGFFIFYRHFLSFTAKYTSSIDRCCCLKASWASFSDTRSNFIEAFGCNWAAFGKSALITFNTRA